MRKAFETNVPRLKPRLRSSFDSGPAGEQASFDSGPAQGGPYAQDERTVIEAVTPQAPSPARAAPVRAAITEAAAAPARQAGDVVSRRDRLEKIKRRVAEAARPAPRHALVPGDPARAAESVLSLVGELESEVSRAREREEALRTDLDVARAELSRAAAEGRSATERLTAAEKELQEKRSVLTELLAEMEALEQERDEAVRRAQALSSLDEERARILEDVTRKADEEAKLRADREAEVERLGEELRTSAADGARLRTAVGELARERDQLAGELDRIRSERDDLASAKRALEQVHAALAQARAKII
jgi:chromosome segregation ATPase